jgi:transcriptional/translational regulatory protein YebC/TACO1
VTQAKGMSVPKDLVERALAKGKAQRNGEEVRTVLVLLES